MRHVLIAIAVGLGIPCLAARADDASGAGSEKFVVRLASYEDTFSGVKIDRHSGTAWWLEPDEKSTVGTSKWTKLDEIDKVQPGDYDVLTAVMQKLKTSSFIRVNRATGDTWMLIGTKWYPMRSN
jgi:hypothetical protein